jgi:hypothetical protein
LAFLVRKRGAMGLERGTNTVLQYYHRSKNEPKPPV